MNFSDFVVASCIVIHKHTLYELASPYPYLQLMYKLSICTVRIVMELNQVKVGYI